MNRQEKAHVVESLKTDFLNSNASFVVRYRGLTVAQLSSLRKKLYEHGGSLQVAKVTLIKRAVRDLSKIDMIEPLLQEQIALVFTKENDSSVIAKTLHDFSKENESLGLLGGIFDSTVLQAEDVKILASLPSREVLLGRLCATLKMPIVRLAVVLKTLIARPVIALKELEQQKVSGK